MTRFKATCIHFLISSTIAMLVVCVMVFVWFPAPLFAVLGGAGLLLLIVCVDVVLGPLLTFIVFKSNKTLLKIDLTVIAVLQIAALAYGIYTIALVRPAFIVFVKDRFELVRAFDPSAENYAAASEEVYSAPPWTGPRLVGVTFPADANVNLLIMESALSGGPDIQYMPKYYSNYDASKAAVAAKAKSLTVLRGLNPTAHAEINGLAAQHKLAESDLGFLGFMAIRGELAVVVDKRNGRVLRTMNLRPW